jgi:hypothetical protein
MSPSQIEWNTLEYNPGIFLIQPNGDLVEMNAQGGKDPTSKPGEH